MASFSPLAKHAALLDRIWKWGADNKKQKTKKLHLAEDVVKQTGGCISTLPPIADFIYMNGASLNGHRQMYEWGASALCDITDANVQQINFLRSAKAKLVEGTIFPRLSGVSCQNPPRTECFPQYGTFLFLFFFKKRVWAAAEQWKRNVGMLYLSMPPFGPRNARAYFPIMALSCKQLPWEAGCSPRSAVRAQPTVLYVSVWLRVRVCVCMHFGGGRECVQTQCCDERALMRDSYYVGLIILAVHEGDCQLRQQLFIKAMKYGPGLRCVCMCAFAQGPSQPTIY